jgi:hypothetical protein
MHQPDNRPMPTSWRDGSGRLRMMPSAPEDAAVVEDGGDVAIGADDIVENRRSIRSTTTSIFCRQIYDPLSSPAFELIGDFVRADRLGVSPGWRCDLAFSR